VRRARWQGGSEQGVRCGLCPHFCFLAPGETGRCGVRTADEEGIGLPCHGRFSSVALDPMEKKPLYHWRPGERILSLGSLGCNLDCPFCQNHSIAHPEGPVELREIPPQVIAEMALSRGVRSVAFTYNEPLVSAEFLLEAIPVLRSQGLAVALVTNGFVNPGPLAELIDAGVAAANVDLKAFREEAYARLGGSLEPVLRTIRELYRSGVHLEITTLLVPGLNDDPQAFEEEVAFLSSLSERLPLHLSRCFPRRHWRGPETPRSLMDSFRNMARKRLRFVYLGNLAGSEATICPNCGAEVLVRSCYNIVKRQIDAAGNCGRCGSDLGIRV